MRVYTIYDSKAQVYNRPWYSLNNATALREFSKAASVEDSDFHMYAADYTLFCIGSWDDHTGVITMQKEHENLGLAAQFIRRENGNA